MYTGVIAPITLGKKGYYGTENVNDIPYDALTNAAEIRYDNNTLRKAPGLSLYNSNAISGTPDILGGIDWRPDSATQRIVTACSDGKLYKEVSGDLDSVTLETGLTISEPVFFLEAGQEVAANNRKLFRFIKGIAPKYLSGDGSSLTAITGAPTDWSGSDQPAAAIYHDFRVWAWGNKNYPHSLYPSTITDHSDFSSESFLTVDVFPGEGDYVAAAHSIASSTRLYVFKYPLGMYWTDTSNVTQLSFAPVIRIRRDIGMAGPLGITKVGSLGTWLIGSDGHIYSLESIYNPDTDLKDGSITFKLNLGSWIRNNVSLSKLKHAKLIWDSNRQEVTAYYTSVTSSGLNDLALVINLQDPSTPRVSIEHRGEYFQTVFYRIESDGYLQIYCGGTGGLIYKANQPNRAVNTTGYTGSFTLPATDFAWLNPAIAPREKLLEWIEFTIVPTGAYNLTVEVYADGVLSGTYSVTLGSAGSSLDDTSTELAPATAPETDFILGGLDPVPHKFKVAARGRRFHVKCYNSSANQDFAISEVLYYFKVLGVKGAR